MCPSSDAYFEYDDGHGFCYSCNQAYFPNTKEFELSEFTYEYVPWRGINKESFKFYDCKFKIDKEGKPLEIQFKYPNGSYKVRDLYEKSKMRTKDASEIDTIGKAGLFGRDKFASGSNKFVTITEGEYDAVSLYQVLRTPVVSVQSSGSGLRDCSVDREWLNGFERIYLAFDNDPKGRELTHRIAKLFDPAKVYVVKFDRRKDANDFLQHNEGDELRTIWHGSKLYLPDNVVSTISDFKSLVAKPVRRGIPYPWKKLTDMTYGLRTGETVMITAQEKVGKTELLHFIEHKILTETEDNVAAFFLEEPTDRHLQALAGIHLGKPVHLPDSGCTPDQVADAVAAVVQKDDRLFIYDHFGGGDPGGLLDTIRYLVTARNVRYVIFDHLSMVTSGTNEDDERRAIDYLASRLEIMVKELDFSLIIVCHLNDNDQTRGSRWPGKVFDMRINASRNMTSPDPIERNTIRLTIVISRYPGTTGPAGALVFDRNTYSFKELDGDDLFSEVAANPSDVGAEKLAA